MKFIRTCLAWRENGQAMIFLALLVPTLCLTLGAAVEGGYVFVTGHRMQAAADMGALVGAEGLPCSTSDTSCISTAETLACNYVAKNGFNSCTAGGGSGATNSADVPPVSCSPYDFMDFGNSNSNAACKSGTAPTYYYYIEVRLTQQVTIPIFNVKFNLYTHAVARQGIFSPKDFAIAVLDDTMSNAFYKNGSNNIVVVGPIMVNSDSSTAMVESGSSEIVACDGGWYTASSQALPSQWHTMDGGQPVFSPVDCKDKSGNSFYGGSGSVDSPTAYFPNQSPIADPYASTSLPSTGNTTCSTCNSNGYYYSWTCSGSRTSGTWSQASSSAVSGSNGQCIELFPGIYPGGISSNNGTTFYLNPGIYTMGGSVTMNGGTMCVYGSPSCDNIGNNIPGTSNNCANSSFSGTGSISSNTWYYYCSPWGIWDDRVGLSAYGYGTGAARPAGVQTTPPYFVGGNMGNIPLNGVTFYMESGASWTLGGNAGKTGMYLAFPNPCPGSGSTFTSASGSSYSSFTGGTVDFTADPIGEPSGNKNAYYTYPSGSVPAQDGMTNSNSDYTSWVYPNADLTLAGECADSNMWSPTQYAGDVWSGEMIGAQGSGQHLHFLIFARDSNSTISWTGNGNQVFWGIVYDPGTQGCASACTISIGGTKGSADGPPLFTGQMVADNVSFTGNSSVEVYYRPCIPPNPCGTGPGTALVE